MSPRGWVGIAALVTFVAASTFAFLSNRTSDEGRVLMCPGAHNSRVFTDTRRLCATKATALARIEGDGRVSFFIDPVEMPCQLPDYSVVNENTTRLVGHGRTRCDTDDTGNSLYVFPHCSLAMNYPGNEDYLPGLPIGLLLKPYDC